ASREQSLGIGQVNQTIAQMDRTTRQNAALVQETGAATRDMEHQAGMLARAAARFQLAAPPPSPPRRTAPDARTAAG
ncbi:MAG TPA: hypothetical protein DD456_05345, partial [Stenotrophomonas sp.]|nr:hypothetical protein [Stenotrophomonas sp.]